MQLFFHPSITQADQEVVFSREESRHIIKVLRKREGDSLHLTNGKGWIFTSEIISASPQGCVAKVLKAEHSPTPAYHLHLAVAPTKMNDRYEWFLEKATEIGVHEITPIICDHSERKIVKLDRFERVLQSAVKQSLNPYFPVLHPAMDLKDFLKQPKRAAKFIAHCQEDEKPFLFPLVQPRTDLIILVGPEGDFSLQEIQEARNQGYVPVSLGKSRLRTETAAIVACHTAVLANEV